jgi:hypothetical protein
VSSTQRKVKLKFADILEMADSEAFIHPEGKKIPAVVHTAVYKKSSNGNDMIAVTFRVTGGPNAGKGRPIRAYLLFNDSGRQQISNLGFPAKDFAKLSDLEADDALTKIAAVVVGKPCALDLTVELYQGRDQNKVGWVHPAGAVTNGPSAARSGPPKPKQEALKQPAASVKEIQPEYEAEDGDDAETAALEAELAARKAAKAKTNRTAPPSDLPF